MWFIKSTADRAGFIMFGEDGTALAANSLLSPPLWITYDLTTFDLEFTYVARTCQGQTDHFTATWTQGCSQLQLTASSNNNRLCASGLQGSYQAFSVCEKSCKLRAGMYSRGVEGSFLIFGKAQGAKPHRTFPVTYYTPQVGTYWLEWQEVAFDASYDVTTVAFRDRDGNLFNEEDVNSICLSRGKYDIRFTSRCNFFTLNLLGDPCTLRGDTLGTDKYLIAYCFSLGFPADAPFLGDSAPTLSLPPKMMLLLFLVALCSSLFLF